MTIDRALRIVRTSQINNSYPSQEYGPLNIQINGESFDRNKLAEKIIRVMPFDTSGVWTFIRKSGLVSKFFNWLTTVAGPVLGWLSKIVLEGAFTYLLAGVGNAFLSASRNVPQKHHFSNQNNIVEPLNKQNNFVGNSPSYAQRAPELNYTTPVNTVSPPSWLNNQTLKAKSNF